MNTNWNCCICKNQYSQKQKFIRHLITKHAINNPEEQEIFAKIGRNTFVKEADVFAMERQIFWSEYSDKPNLESDKPKLKKSDKLKLKLTQNRVVLVKNFFPKTMITTFKEEIFTIRPERTEDFQKQLYEFKIIPGKQYERKLTTKLVLEEVPYAKPIIEKLDKLVSDLVPNDKLMKISETISIISRSNTGFNEIPHSDSTKGDNLHMLLILSDSYDPPMFYKSVLPGEPITSNISVKPSGQATEEFRKPVSERFKCFNNLLETIQAFYPISTDPLNVGDMIIFYSDTPHFSTTGGSNSNTRTSVFLKYYTGDYVEDKQLHLILLNKLLYGDNQEKFFDMFYQELDNEVVTLPDAYFEKADLADYSSFFYRKEGF
ncbi:hypothetical protein BC833DRAFT_637415 [Globomyces pollinis-pini]|nr:hypothetical protein BC833DRAFT_637415 [Globomyces pollinis-pini]